MKQELKPYHCGAEANQINWKKMAEASMEFANEVSQNVVESYQLKQQNNE